jgi:hypothetical protein
VEVVGDEFPSEFDVPVAVEHLGHHEADGDGVGACPRLGLVMEEAELGGERIGMLRDEEVNATGVVVERSAVSGA